MRSPAAPADVLHEVAPEAPRAAVWRDWTSSLMPAGDVAAHHVPMNHPTRGGVWPESDPVGFYGIPGVPMEAADGSSGASRGSTCQRRAAGVANMA